MVVPRHPSLQSTRTRRPGGGQDTSTVAQSLRKPTMRTLQQLPSFKGCPTRLGRATLQLATAGNCSGHRKRALRQTCSQEDPENAICVQRLDDSLNSAIRTRYRILLRSSSMHKPRDPPLEVVNGSVRPRGLSKHHTNSEVLTKRLWPQGPRPRLLAGV